MKKNVKWIGEIKADDKQDGAVIKIGVIRVPIGYDLIASNGDDVSIHHENSVENCINDFGMIWGNWNTFKSY